MERRVVQLYLFAIGEAILIAIIGLSNGSEPTVALVSSKIFFLQCIGTFTFGFLSTLLLIFIVSFYIFTIHTYKEFHKLKPFDKIF